MGLRRTVRNATLRVYEGRLGRSLDRSALPRHVGVIHDGHRRFARATGLKDYTTSYRAGMGKFVDFLGWCEEFDIPHVTCWLLSKENLERPEEELAPYFQVLVDLFDRLPDAVSADTRFSVMGSLDLLPDHLRTSAERLAERRKSPCLGEFQLLATRSNAAIRGSVREAGISAGPGNP